MIAKVNYYVHRDHFGRIYFDTCKTNEEHMNAPVPDGESRRQCRFYLEDMIKDEMIGKLVTVSLVDMSQFVSANQGRTCFTFALSEMRDEDSI